MNMEDVEKIINTETFRNPLCRYERVLALKDGYCIFELLVREDEILLNNIRVSETDTNKGFGSAGLKWLQNISEISRFIIKGSIEPNSHKQKDYDSLKKWYVKNGFVVEGGNIVYFPKSLYTLHKTTCG